MDPMFLCESCGGYLGDENRQPKILYCGHSFCTYCVADFFEDDAVHCFKCGFKHHAKSTTRIPVNHILLKIIKSKEMSNERVVGPMTMPQGNTQETYLSHHEPWSSYPGRKNSHTQTAFGEPVQHAGKCVKHTLYCTLWCRRCKEWICQDCRLVSHPPVSCKVLTLSEALKEIKLEENYCIKRTVELFESHVVIYREKLSHLREMNGKHRSLIKDLQTLLGKHRKLEREVEKRELTIQESLATGFSMLLMLLESQSHLLEAKGLGEVLLARQSAQGCQSAILGWYEPKLLDDTEEITISDGFQKGTMAAMTVLKHSMGLSFNQRVSDEASDFTSFTGNDQEELVMCVKHMMESPYWKVILGKIESDDTVDGNSMYRLAQGAQRIDSRLYDFDGRIYYNARSRFSRSTNVYVEKLIDISTGSAEGSDVWYQKYRKPELLAERGGRVYGEPFSTSLLDEITDDCYYQLRSEISQHASGAEGECPEGLTGKFKDAKLQGAFPKHMIPLTPTKDKNELQLGLTRTETSRDDTGYPKGFFMKPLEAEGKDIYKKEPRGRSMPAATAGCVMGVTDQFTLATDPDDPKLDSATFMTNLKPISKISNTRARTTKAVTLYPEWERGPIAIAGTDDHFKPLLPFYTKDTPGSGGAGASVWKEQQDYSRGKESCEKSDKGACGEEQDTPNGRGRKDETGEDSGDTDTFIKNEL